MRIVVSVLLLIIVCEAADVRGQVYYGGYRPYGYGAWGGAYPGYYGGTVAGSAAAGMGAMIQAQGAYNQMTAQAAISAEQARSLALDNKLKSAQTYYQLQRLNQENRAEQERQRLAARVDYTPPPRPRLSSEQLDPVTGAIAWPATLTGADFLPERTKLDELFAARARNPALASASQVTADVLAMRNKLDAKFESVAQGDFFAARHFLDMLADAARTTGMEDTHAAVPPPPEPKL
jgi:hypothetical protein